MSQATVSYAFLAHSTDQDPPPPRFRAYREVLLRHDLGNDPDLVVAGADERVAAYRVTAAMLRRRPAPDAIFAASDRAAISAIWAIRDAGLDVPGRVAVVGVGNIGEGEITRPRLSTVGEDISRLHEVADLLFRRLAGDADQPRGLHLPARFIRRGSA